MSQTIEKPGVRYIQRDDAIYEFVFTGKSDNALDHFFEILRQLLKESDPDEVYCYLVDVTRSAGQAPMSDLVKRFRRLQIEIPERAAGRTAIVHDGSIMLTLVNTFLDTLAPAQDKARFFKQNERERAITWLHASR